MIFNRVDRAYDDGLRHGWEAARRVFSYLQLVQEVAGTKQQATGNSANQRKDTGQRKWVQRLNDSDASKDVVLMAERRHVAQHVETAAACCLG